jgi:predicted ArsR family transcriptional regulator
MAGRRLAGHFQGHDSGGQTRFRERDSAGERDSARDRDFARERDVAAVSLLDEPTRLRLYQAVVDHGLISRDAAARAVDISRDLAAFHLDRMVEGGLLKVSYRRLSGRTGPGAGRPAKLYTRADAEISVSLPARRYDLLAETLAQGLDALATSVGEKEVTAAVGEPARQHGRTAGTAIKAAAGPRATRKRRAERLVELLETSGFEPAVAANGKTITLGNCPYRGVAESHRDLTCGMNLAWAEGVLEAAGQTGYEPRLDIEPGRCCVVLTRE